MPRTHWVQKNRYCWNANLSEDTFLHLLKLYAKGHTSTRAAKTIARHAQRFGTKKVSRQTINRYFLMFGEYLYLLIPDEDKFAHVAPMGMEGMIDDPEHVEKIITTIYKVFYNRLEHKDIANKILIGIKQQDIFDRLIDYSVKRKGLPMESFAVHFTHVLYHSITERQFGTVHVPSVIYEIMKFYLEQYPLNSFELVDIRLSKL